MQSIEVSLFSLFKLHRVIIPIPERNVKLFRKFFCIILRNVAARRSGTTLALRLCGMIFAVEGLFFQIKIAERKKDASLLIFR